MFITALVVLFIIKLRFPKGKSIHNNNIITREAGLTPREPSISYCVFDESNFCLFICW